MKNPPAMKNPPSMKRLLSLIFSFVRSAIDGALRASSDFVTVRLMLGQALRGVPLPEPFWYHGWYVNLVALPEGLLVLVAGRRASSSKLEDVATLLGRLVRLSHPDPGLPPFQVASRSARLTAWGWRRDGRELSEREQRLILSVVFERDGIVERRRDEKRQGEKWKSLN